MEKDDKGSTMIPMGVSGWKFLLVPAYPGCPGSKAVKRSLLLLLIQSQIWTFARVSNNTYRKRRRTADAISCQMMNLWQPTFRYTGQFTQETPSSWVEFVWPDDLPDTNSEKHFLHHILYLSTTWLLKKKHHFVYIGSLRSIHSEFMCKNFLYRSGSPG